MSHRSLKTNILRNLRDQPLHMLWGFASVYMPYLAYRYLAQWTLYPAIVLGLLSIGWIVVREYRQYPPHDWWDAPLDWSMYTVGGMGAVGSVAMSTCAVVCLI